MNVADFDIIADYYDAMYVSEDGYQEETDKIIKIEERYNLSDNKNLLDLGCGTGEQTKNLAIKYKVSGLDLSDKMLEIAKRKISNAKFYKADMFDFKLPNKYGIVINLFGSIGFAKSYQEMLNGLKAVWNVLEKGGILILTPWDTAEVYKDTTWVGAGEKNGISFCYLEKVKRVDNVARIEMFHTIEHAEKVKQYYHVQNVTIFSEQEYRNALQESGFEICARLTEKEFRMGAFICRK